MEKDSIIVLSGGMDSVTLLYELRHRIAMALTFDYGSNHNAREIEMARTHCAELEIPHTVIPLDFIAEYFHSSLLAGADTVPEGDYAEANMRSTVVPFRNGIMLAVACGMAENYGLSHVMLANHGGDHAIYPDCRPDFIDFMSHAMASGTYQKVDILAPYTELSKAEIARRGASLGVDYSRTYSCYKGGERHCGRCGTCVERRQAMREAAIEDPTIYDDDADF